MSRPRSRRLSAACEWWTVWRNGVAESRKCPAGVNGPPFEVPKYIPIISRWTLAEFSETTMKTATRNVRAWRTQTRRLCLAESILFISVSRITNYKLHKKSLLPYYRLIRTRSAWRFSVAKFRSSLSLNNISLK